VRSTPLSHIISFVHEILNRRRHQYLADNGLENRPAIVRFLQLYFQAYFLSRADFSSLVNLLFQALLLRPNSLGSGFVLPTLIFPPLFRNS
jgi:hypothetical protein